MAAKKTQSKAKPKIVSRNRPAAFPVISGRRLVGKAAVITGGGRGIGLAIAKAFAAEGCSIVIAVRKTGQVQALTELSRVVERETGAIVMELECDVRHEDSVRRLWAQVGALFGSLDILVNNAGVSQKMLPASDTPLELWQDVIATNLTGTFLCTREALPFIPRGGTIINLISSAAKRNFVNFAAYNASKAGALSFTLTLREELMPRGIRVVALIPGATSTEIWEQFWPDAPRHRMIDVDSIAQAALYAVLLPESAHLSEMLIEPTSGSL